MDKQHIVSEAKNFIQRDNTFSQTFPTDIAHYVMANFTHTLLENDLNLSKEDLYSQVIVYVQESQIEELYDVIELFAEAVSDFASTFILDQTSEHSKRC